MTAESLDDLALAIAYLRNEVNTADEDKLVAAADAIVTLRARAEEQDQTINRLASSLEKDTATMQRANELITRLNAAITWAMGEGDSDFRPRADGEGQYYWRKELIERARGQQIEKDKGG